MSKLFLLLFFLTSSLSAATITRYVNPGSSGGDGTTSALTGANAAYASLSAWEAAENADLTDSGGDVMRVYCAGTSSDTAACAIDGWTVGSTNYIWITGDNMTGKWDTAKYRHAPTGAYDSGLSINENYTKIENLQFNNWTSDGTGAAIEILGDNTITDVTIQNCIFYKPGTRGLGGIWCEYRTPNLKVYNNLFVGNSVGDYPFYYGCMRLGYGTNTNNQAYNNTMYGGGKAAELGINCDTSYGPAHLLKNNFAANFSTCYNNVAGYSASGANNVSSDLTGDDFGSGGLVSKTAYSDYFVDYAAFDFHLKSTDIILLGGGVDLSGSFTIDIDGETRSGTWDIGADEYVSGEEPPAAVPYYPPHIIIE